MRRDDFEAALIVGGGVAILTIIILVFKYTSG